MLLRPMRMLHYYLALAIPTPLLLLATMWSGLTFDGSQRHVGLGLVTAILCVATHTLLILFMIVTGRVLKAAMQARRLPAAFLGELNDFFANKKAYPTALGAATATAATAVLGYGRNIGVPIEVHMLCGIAIVALNTWAITMGVKSLRGNQDLIDRAAAELDALDARNAEAAAQHGGSIEGALGDASEASLTEAALDAAPQYAFGARTRWFAFAVSAWLPYLYWVFVVWRGDFTQVSPAFLGLSALVSALGVFAALRTR